MRMHPWFECGEFQRSTFQQTSHHLRQPLPHTVIMQFENTNEDARCSGQSLIALPLTPNRYLHMHRPRYTQSENDTLLQAHQRAQYSLYAHAAAYLATGLSGTGLNAPCRPSMQALWVLQEPELSLSGAINVVWHAM